MLTERTQPSNRQIAEWLDKISPMYRRSNWSAGLYTLVLAWAIVVPAALAQSAQVQEAFQRGALAMRNGRVQDAETAFREAVRLDPSQPEAHLDLGLVLGREGRLDEAVASVNEALKLNPKLDSAHMFLGIFLYQSNRQEDARQALTAALQETPDNVEALTWMGMVEMSLNHPERAVGPFDRAHELAPKDLNVLEYRGRAHNMVARDSYAEMAKADPGSWHVHRVQGELFADEGRHSEAITEFAAATKLEPRNPELWEALGDEYRKANQLDQAQKAFAKELELSPQNAIAMYNLGSTDVERGDNAAGVPLLEAMLKQYHDAPVAQYYVGRGLAGMGRDQEAAGWLEQSAKSDPAGEISKRSFYELARLYRRMQEPDEAAKALAEYTRIRDAQDKKNAQQVQDWRKLQTGTPTP